VEREVGKKEESALKVESKKTEKSGGKVFGIYPSGYR
jgi:hypothetical protein